MASTLFDPSIEFINPQQSPQLDNWFRRPYSRCANASIFKGGGEGVNVIVINKTPLTDRLRKGRHCSPEIRLMWPVPIKVGNATDWVQIFE